MRIALDTEFNGHGGELIAVALVAEDGNWFYAVLPLPLNVVPWVAENVIPVLGQEPEELRWARVRLSAWLTRFDDPIVVCDWPADLMHFCRLLEGESFEEATPRSFKAEMIISDKGLAPVTPHNALSDARALLNWVVQQRAAA